MTCELQHSKPGGSPVGGCGASEGLALLVIQGLLQHPGFKLPGSAVGCTRPRYCSLCFARSTWVLRF